MNYEDEHLGAVTTVVGGVLYGVGTGLEYGAKALTAKGRREADQISIKAQQYVAKVEKQVDQISKQSLDIMRTVKQKQTETKKTDRYTLIASLAGAGLAFLFLSQ